MQGLLVIYWLLLTVVYDAVHAFKLNSLHLKSTRQISNHLTGNALFAVSDPSIAVSNEDHDILVRAYRGEEVNRSPVWLLRQAGRYMADFRKFSSQYDFRTRSETPELAIELSLQPWKKYQMDGVIMFSDILTILPALGIDFEVISGKGIQIKNFIHSQEEISQLKRLENVDEQLPFMKTILTSLRKELDGKTSLIGFIGAPFTLASYCIHDFGYDSEDKMKLICNRHADTLHALLRTLTDALKVYCDAQVQYGAQILQLFESHSYKLSESNFNNFAKPYIEEIVQYVKDRHPTVPIVYYANGGGHSFVSQLELPVDSLSIGSCMTMKTARKLAGENRVLAGNIDPLVLFSGKEDIETAVRQCIDEAGRSKHVVNVGSGILQGTPEEAVGYFVEAAKSYRY